jgi:hypothetical protein
MFRLLNTPGLQATTMMAFMEATIATVNVIRVSPKLFAPTAFLLLLSWWRRR